MTNNVAIVPDPANPKKWKINFDGVLLEDSFPSKGAARKKAKTLQVLKG